MQPHFNIQQILNGDEQQLSELFNSINSAPLAMRTSTADKFFARVFNRNPLDESCADLLAELKNTFVNQVCQSDRFYCDATHPLRGVFEVLLTRAITWYPRDAKVNQQFFEKLSEIIHLAGLPQQTQNLITAVTEFNEWDYAEEKRATMLEERLCESELNNFKLLTAECRVLDLINEALTGSNVPTMLAEFIPGILKSELQHCAFTSGIGSPFWKTWQRLLPLIANIFNVEVDKTIEQQFYHHIPAIIEELERSTHMDIGNPEQYSQFVEILTQTLMCVIKKQSLELCRLSMLPYPAGHSDTRTRATDSVLQQGACVQQDDWILFTTEDEKTIRCKLALRNPTADQLLFVDRTGRKVMTRSNKDLSLCLSTGIAKPLLLTPLAETIEELVSALITLHNNNILRQQKISQTIQQENQPEEKSFTANTEQQLQEQEDQTTSISEEQQQFEIAKLQRIAAEKAIAEAKILAEKKAARIAAEASAEKNREAQHAAQEESDTQQLIAQQQISALNIGAWIERFDEQQQKQRCKLAAIIASAGKYIFVDNLGRKVAEYQREELHDAFVRQQLFIINNGEKFEDQLEKVIRCLRKDAS